MKKSRIQYVILITLILAQGFSCLGQRIYLSGTGPENAKDWDFKISTGRKSGYWTSIPVPSNWELHGFGHYTYGEDKEDYKINPEIGYYRTTFNLPQLSDNCIKLTFQGSMTDTHVRVNGNKVGPVHQGGFMQFSYDITSFVHAGENLLEVAVYKSSQDKVVQDAERVTDFWLFGGIFRPVYIEIFPSEYINRVAIDALMDGHFIMDVYTVNVKKAKSIRLHIKDKSDGRTVSKCINKIISDDTDVFRFEEVFNGIQAWSHEYPRLYTVTIELLNGSMVLHRYDQNFGFRTFEIRDHDGFYLNGKRIVLKGAAMHCIRPETGRSLSKKDIEEDFHRQKKMNANVVRACHYPPDAYFLDLCDSLGMLVMVELTGWNDSLNKEKGGILVKEMIARDVNHPSVILWSNGNHKAHNPELDEDFFRWDIQKRRPLRNYARTEAYPANYFPDFDIVDTRYYPNFNQLTERLAGKRIVCPNESLHALYDGGGAASLYEYWNAIKASEVGGGIILWALYDEAVIRSDMTNTLDMQINKAPDGILGPHGEPEGSYFAAREIWSPVIFQMDLIPSGFTGEIEVKNDFDFVNLNECKIDWRLINFTSKDEAMAGYRVKYEGTFPPADIRAGAVGTLRMELPDGWDSFDAMLLSAYDHTGKDLLQKTLPIQSWKTLSGEFVNHNGLVLIQDSENPYRFRIGDYDLRFSDRNGTLKEVRVKDSLILARDFPFLVAESDENKICEAPADGKVSLREEGENYIIEYQGEGKLSHIKWILSRDGNLSMDYQYILNPGNYYYAGIGMGINPEDVIGKRWLGYGPYRVWNNRMQGGTLNVWDVEKQISVPGEVYNYPEFEGFFKSCLWAIVRFKKQLNVGISLPENDLVMGMLNPVNGAEPLQSSWQYPTRDGLYFFNSISAVGTKWKQADELGPSSQPNLVSGPLSGKIKLNFSWNQNSNNVGGSASEIE